MPHESDPPRSGRYRAVPNASHPSAWQLTGAPDRSPFFFAWGGGPPRFGPNSPVAEADVRPGRSLRRRASASAATLWLRRAGVALAGDEADDDATLSVCGTSLYDRTKRQSDPDRYVDTASVPFLTLSARMAFRSTGVGLGDHATVIAPGTGRVVHAIVGDARPVSGAEPSLFLAEALGLSPSDPAVYLVYPGTGLGQGLIPDPATIHRHGETLFRLRPQGGPVAWIAVLRDCFGDLMARGPRRG